MLIVTLAAKLVSTLPKLSWAATRTAGVMIWPATAFEGWTVNTS
jgi:hypothetical protein